MVISGPIVVILSSIVLIENLGLLASIFPTMLVFHVILQMRVTVGYHLTNVASY